MFSSKLSFILTAVGAAVGLGNVFRFPYLAMKYGLAFVLIYVIFLCALGLPMLLSEIAFGRRFCGQAPGKRAAFSSKLCAFNSLFIFGYYTLLTALVLLAAFFSAGGDFSALFSLSEGQYKGGFGLPLVFLAFAFAAVLFCFGDAERIGKISTASVLFSLIVLFLLALFRATASPEALLPLLRLDFSHLLEGSFWFDALSQVFFSLSIAIGVLTAYGGLLRETESIVSCGIYIASIDLLVSFLAAAIYATVGGRAEGLFDSFSVYPSAFFELGAAGGFLCFLFYTALGFLCLDSVVSFLKSSVVLLYPKFIKKEGAAAALLTLFAAAFALALLLFGAKEGIAFTDGKITPTLILLGGLSLTLLFSKKEVFEGVTDELKLGKSRALFKVLLRLFAPAFILLLLFAQIFF